MTQQQLRRLEDLPAAEQIEVLAKIQALLIDVLAESLFPGVNVRPDAAAIKAMEIEQRENAVRASLTTPIIINEKNIGPHVTRNETIRFIEILIGFGYEVTYGPFYAGPRPVKHRHWDRALDIISREFNTGADSFTDLVMAEANKVLR